MGRRGNGLQGRLRYSFSDDGNIRHEATILNILELSEGFKHRQTVQLVKVYRPVLGFDRKRGERFQDEIIVWKGVECLHQELPFALFDVDEADGTHWDPSAGTKVLKQIMLIWLTSQLLVNHPKDTRANLLVLVIDLILDVTSSLHHMCCPISEQVSADSSSLRN